MQMEKTTFTEEELKVLNNLFEHLSRFFRLMPNEQEVWNKIQDKIQEKESKE